MEGGAIAAGLEQVGADRLRERGIIDLQRDIFAGLFAGAGPARADLRTVLVAGMNAVVWRVLGVAMIGGDYGQLDVERERPQSSGEAVFRCG